MVCVFFPVQPPLISDFLLFTGVSLLRSCFVEVQVWHLPGYCGVLALNV